MTTQDFTVGVLICTHDERRLQRMTDAVRSVRAQTRPPDELLVMVDGVEQLADVVRRAVPAERVDCMGSNQGVSMARTEAARRMTSDYVVFLDDDAVADADWLRRLVDPLHDDRVLGASGASIPVFDTGRPSWLPDEFLWALGCSYLGLPTTTAQIRNFFGGSAVVDRRVFLDLGGFAEDAGHHGESVGGGEEATFCLQATAQTGGIFMYEPSAVTEHQIPASRLTLRYLVKRCFGEGIMKSRMAGKLGADSLDDERSFAAALPGAMLRYALRPATAPRVLGIVVGAASVVAGLAWGRVQRLLAGRRR